MAQAKIPATVITGFLGAGKTTLIRNLIAQADGRRLALIVNEFGEVGVDGDLLRACGLAACDEEDIVELANGCLCCTVADDFVPTMTKLIERENPPEHIVIETSGLALPQPLVKAFRWPGIRTRVTVDSVIVVVDGAAAAEGRFADDEEAVAAQRAADPSVEHDSPIAELFEDQLKAADLIILNKMDLLDETGAGRAEAVIGEHKRGAAGVVRTAQGQLPLSLLLGLGFGSEEDIDNRPSHHELEGEEHDHEDFESVALEGTPARDAGAFAAALPCLIAEGNLLRLKGFAAVQGSDMRLVVQAVGPRVETYFDRPWAPGEARATRLVAIGERGLDHAGLSRALERACTS